MPTVRVQLGAPAAGWNTWLAVHSADRAQDWNGTAFVTASAAAKNAGGFDGEEDPDEDGTFTYEVEGPDAGVYAATAYRRLGGANDAANDTVLTYETDLNTVLIGGDVGVDLTYTPGERFTGAAEVVEYPRGSGLPFVVTPAEPTAIVAGEREVRVGVPGVAGSYDTFSAEEGNLVEAEATGVLIANPTAAQSAAWSLVGTLRVEVWRVAGDDGTYPEAIYRLDLRGTLYAE